MKEEKPIPRIRANGRDIDAMVGLHAAMTEINVSAEAIERRIRAVPNGWRDLRLIQSLLDKLIDRTLDTYPVEKLVTMRRMLPRVRFRITVGPQATSPLSDDETVISFDDVDALTTYARKQCELCVDYNCNRCKLGKTLDRVLRYDRDGGCWAFAPINAEEE